MSGSCDINISWWASSISCFNNTRITTSINPAAGFWAWIYHLVNPAAGMDLMRCASFHRCRHRAVRARCCNRALRYRSKPPFVTGCWLLQDLFLFSCQRAVNWPEGSNVVTGDNGGALGSVWVDFLRDNSIDGCFDDYLLLAIWRIRFER